ncbi:MAG: 4-hydroxy-tetrahydrodipicolinate reductase [Pseudomonadota bacterium]|jgi:4-hydroxy-tetrahydrodipicolinate reductase|nr:4-hydroxy-tetrahydrodipicolinate reductase [Pseudomonadota bacterium]|tara:strand:+ start:926 stop:1732 length:807 start_codon:yes stop_codon:yes gene_type:complete
MIVKIGVCGAAGKMGKAILEVCKETDGVEIGAAIEHPESSEIGADAGEVAGIGKLGIEITDDILSVSNEIDVMIDFTLATSVIQNIDKCISSNCKMVIGTTGLYDKNHARIKSAANEIAIVFAPNMSIGVNLCFKLLEMTSNVIGKDADIEIIEAHHRDKKDSPSGTAIRMGEIVADATERNLKDCAVYGREGNTGPRDKNTIGFETIRAGDIVGDHTVVFATTGERIEITHKATSRKTFATGAVKAAQWLGDKQKGLFDMQDVLNLK